MKALIFDMDGTLVDSEKVHKKAFLKGLDELGISYDFDDVQKFLLDNEGIPDYIFSEEFVKKYKLDIKAEELVRLKRDFYKDLIGSDVEAFPGVVDFVKSLDSSYKLALATSSSVEDMERVLKKIGLFDVIEIKVSGANLENPKPAPDIFLMTADKLGFDIKDCLIFEDSQNGLLAAERSGAKVIAYDYKKDGAEFLKNYYTIDDYRDLSPSKLEKIFKNL